MSIDAVMGANSALNRRLNAMLVALRAVENGMGLHLLLTIIAIAQRPGLSVNELAETIEAPQQTASRYVSILQGRYQLPGSENEFAREPLVSLQVNTQEPRRRALFLTAEGQERLSEIVHGLYGGKIEQ